MEPAPPTAVGTYPGTPRALRADRFLRRRDSGQAAHRGPRRRRHLERGRPARLPGDRTPPAGGEAGQRPRTDQRTAALGRRRRPGAEPADAGTAAVAEGRAGTACPLRAGGPAPCLPRSRPARRPGLRRQPAAQFAGAGLPEAPCRRHRPAPRHAQLGAAGGAGLARRRPHHPLRGDRCPGQRGGRHPLGEPAVRRRLHRSRYRRGAEQRDGRFRRRHPGRQQPAWPAARRTRWRPASARCRA